MPGIKVRIKSYWSELYAILRRVLPTFILFEILYRAVTALILKPILTLVLQLTLRVTGYHLAFNNDIWGFFLTPAGIIGAIILLVLAALITYYEFAVIIIVGHCGVNGCDVTLQGAMERAWHSLRTLRSPGTIGFLAYTLLLLPIANMGYASSLLPNFSIPNFVLGELEKMTFGPVLVVLIYVAIFVVFFCSIFTLPVMVLREVSFGKAFAASFGLIRKYGRRILGTFIVFAAIWALLFKLPSMFQSYILYSPKIDFQAAIHETVISWIPFFNGLLTVFTFVVGIFLLPILMIVVLYSYKRNVGDEGVHIDLNDPLLVKGARNPVSVESLKGYWAKFRGNKWVDKVFAWVAGNKRLRKFRFVIIGGVALVIVLVVISALDSGYALHQPIVVGHRGSFEGVENTTGAVEGAIDAGADFAEVDILLSKDGVPMVVHDPNLTRLSGQNLNVGEMTAKELSQVELSQYGFTGRISTLREMVQFCKGRIRLILEIKTHGQETANPVDETFEVLEDEKYADQCFFISLDYNVLMQVKERNPDSIAGYCVYGNVGSLSPSLINTMNIDFIVVEEGMATPALVKQFRRAWLPVYVWTVNDAQSMMKYLDMGIIGLVTDDPMLGTDTLKIYNETTNVAYLPESEQLPVKD